MRSRRGIERGLRSSAVRRRRSARSGEPYLMNNSASSKAVSTSPIGSLRSSLMKALVSTTRVSGWVHRERWQILSRAGSPPLSRWERGGGRGTDEQLSPHPNPPPNGGGGCLFPPAILLTAH